ncbi:type III-B CRISPR module-associated protein Cmr5 [Candidatus Methanocrinis natronophilus]|uniref:CRISPR type III-B/RAMP module-associated protein Cmr5 n=1 Tax=Candidatus Methanocrinis natronophilus TaxID=3033396 RepID=A0ABT5X4P4_9EURY|nr:type III-B CRISPR module-associated protein Cmr5 [Candidatus Methanocrinis natronophilus]MDF0589660.1 type III-B CRISPR module-associated protein Cmr5 [Candidatus Methanocrinis natronophilus]
MSENVRQTRQQIRAKIAYGCVSSAGEKMKTKDTEDYAQLAKKFPALVHNCGLAQAIAFVQAKEGKTGESYIGHLANTMGEEGDIGSTSRSSDLMTYQRLTREAIESATWLKRYSEALLGD